MLRTLVLLVVGLLLFTGTATSQTRQDLQERVDDQALNNCRRYVSTNATPQAWFGVMVCGVGDDVMPLTGAEWDDMTNCLDEHGQHYSDSRMIGWRIRYVDDLISYSLSKVTKGFGMGFTDVVSQTIFIRGTLAFWGRRAFPATRAVLRHEVMHVILTQPIKEHHPREGPASPAFVHCDVDY